MARPGVNTVLSKAKGDATKNPAKDIKSTAAAPAKTAAPTSSAAKTVTIQPKTTVAASPTSSNQLATAKNPAVFPTAQGGALEGKTVAAPGNAMNKITLDAWRASGGTTTNTYVDKYTNMDNRGETALQEAARTQAGGTIAIFDKVAAAAGKPAMQISGISGKNTETAQQKYVPPAPKKQAPILNAAVSNGVSTKPAQVVATPISSPATVMASANVSPFSILGNFFSGDPFHPVNPAILQTPEQKAQLQGIPPIVINIPQYLADQKRINDIKEWTAIRVKQDARTSQFQQPATVKKTTIDLTPGFNLGISDGSLIKKIIDVIPPSPTSPPPQIQ